MPVPIFRFVQGVKTQIGSVDDIGELALAMSRFDFDKMMELGLVPHLHSYSFVGALGEIIEIIEED